MLFIFAACIPLAILLGIMLATPLDASSLMIVGIVFMVLLTPIMLKHHHGFLIFSWGAFMNAFFLPGQPPLWMLMAVLSLFFSILTRAVNRNNYKFLNVPSLTWSLLALSLVILVTAQLTGGIGLRSFGSEVYGGKRYFFLFGAVLLYFAFVWKKIEPEKSQFYAGMLLLTSVTAGFSNLAYTLGPSFNFLFLLFPAEWAIQQAMSDFGGPEIALTRVSGLSPACGAVISFYLLRYGLAGVLDLRRPMRIIMVSLALAIGLFSGFRAHLVLQMLLVFFLFLSQKLYRTRLLPLTIVACCLAFAFVAAVSDRLPLTVQRSLAILPLRLDPVAVQDAKVSMEWRLDMWNVVIQELPKYLLLGKGYALDPTDIFLTEEAVRRGQLSSYESAISAGDYHNGPLSILMTFGIFGALTFSWVLAAGTRVLWKNYRYGAPELWNINSFLLAFYLAHLVFFLVIFGSFQTDLVFFTGIFGFSISVNHGVRKREDLELAMEPAPAENEEVVEYAPVQPRPGLVGV
jgi:hypothetical protein